jgi:drug/metabolite transporter (DMT)-like permease
MTLTASFAAFFLKKSTSNETFLSFFSSKYFYIGGFLYIIAAIFNIWILKIMPYSVVIPLGSITYIWTMLIARLFLKEKVRTGKIIGTLLIITGVVFTAV